jgi:8-oxo-dGTP pyrophosphatase MutT (NUDIX family)
MKTLLTLRDKDLGFKEKRTRFPRSDAMRVILFDKRKIAIIKVAKSHYYMLPGGGIRSRETHLRAIQREISEETGCTAEVSGELGAIKEYRSHTPSLRINHGNIAKVITIGKPHYEKGEIKLGYSLQWVTPSKALDFIRKSNPTTYLGHFIVKRDARFLEEAMRKKRGVKYRTHGKI